MAYLQIIFYNGNKFVNNKPVMSLIIAYDFKTISESIDLNVLHIMYMHGDQVTGFVYFSTEISVYHLHAEFDFKAIKCRP